MSDHHPTTTTTPRKRATRQAPTPSQTAARVEAESVPPARLRGGAVCPYCGSKVSRGVCLGCAYVVDSDPDGRA